MYANMTIVRYQILCQKKILEETEGKKSKIIGCVGGVADDEVPVGEENGILRCDGGTVRTPSG